MVICFVLPSEEEGEKLMTASNLEPEREKKINLVVSQSGEKVLKKRFSVLCGAALMRNRNVRSRKSNAIHLKW